MAEEGQQGRPQADRAPGSLWFGAATHRVVELVRAERDRAVLERDRAEADWTRAEQGTERSRAIHRRAAYTHERAARLHEDAASFQQLHHDHLMDWADRTSTDVSGADEESGAVQPA